MTKRKVIRKNSQLFTYNPHYYSWGGDFKKALGETNPFDFKDTFSGGNVAAMLKGGLASGLGSTIGNVAGSTISGGLKSGAGSAISGVGSTIGGLVGTVNPVLGGIISAGSGILGGVTNALFGSKLNQDKINEINATNKSMNTLVLDNSNNDSVLNQWASQDFGTDFSKSSIGRDGLFSNKAKNTYNKLKREQGIARNRALTAFENAADAADMTTDLSAATNFAAYGGPLSMWGDYGSGATNYELAKEDLGIKAMNTLSKNKITSLPNSFNSPELNTFSDGGKIYIKPENRGKFTALKERTGKSATWFKEHGTPAQKKMATFALNSRHWSHAFGGDLLTHGTEWDNGLTIVGNGDSHENNPYEGVQMGVDNQGIPNLVEEGEVIWNDYVFSDRLKVPDAVRNKYKLRGNKELTFADAAKQMKKESEERPNDPISKRGLMSSMTRLQQAQEVVREKKQANQEGAQYAKGGKLGNLFAGPGEEPQVMARAKAKRQGYNIGSSLEDYLKDPVYENVDDSKSDLSWLRYAPVVGSAIGLGQNLFSGPDYSSADTILEAANQAGNYTPIGYTPIGNYLTYKPFDRNYYINKANAQAGATRRAIMNSISPSRNATLLAADYNALGRLGDLARQAEEYNLAQRQAVEQFNRGTNQANAEMGLKAAMANQEAALKARSTKLSGIAQAMSLRDAIDARRDASMSANLTNLFDSLGNIGIDEMNRADRDMLIRAGVFGTLSEKPQGWSNKRWEDYKKAISGKGYSRGGKLKKRRGGLTY